MQGLNFQCGDATGGVFSLDEALQVSEPHVSVPVPVPNRKMSNKRSSRARSNGFFRSSRYR
jgi:hypothetical protein